MQVYECLLDMEKQINVKEMNHNKKRKTSNDNNLYDWTCCKNKRSKNTKENQEYPLEETNRQNNGEKDCDALKDWFFWDIILHSCIDEENEQLMEQKKYSMS